MGDDALPRLTSLKSRSHHSDLVPLEPVECQSADQARRRAGAAAAVHAGAVAFSRTGDPASGEFGEATVIATYGEVDVGMLGA